MLTKQLRLLLPATILFSLVSCVSQPPPANPTSWFFVNSGSRMTIVIQDLVCNRRYANVRISPRAETEVETCGDENNMAHVRYRADGYASRAGAWTTREVRAGGRVYLQ